MTTQELANQVTAMLKEGRFEDVQRQFWADDILVVEPMDGPMARLQGWEQIRPKLEWWGANHEVHGVEVEGPFVHGDQFALLMTIDVTPKDQPRHKLAEIVLYHTAGGKITEEHYYYGG